MALGDWIRDAFAFLGPGGILAAMFLIFLVDAAIFPALPEVFIVLFYTQLVDTWFWSTAAAAGSLLVLALTGDLCGNAGMYGIMKWFQARGKVPRTLEKAMKKWTSFLAVRDERIILVNRIAPAVPFTGAFIAVCGWNLRRSLAYVLLGGVVKYMLLLVLVIGLGLAFDPEAARLVTLVAVVVLVVASLAAGWYRGRKREVRA
jgi:membrane protein YqaA with SNARE-associated domain